ncbi:MAG: hypothetical protein KC731_12750, partial [Myxococcales bacterium]|nr:hypothetical protein [Myxococcales bacterium]
VIVSTHGAPGVAEWGSGTIDGPGLGSALRDAGFQRDEARPGAKVELSVCNGATPPQGGTFADSIAGGIARQTGAPTSGALSNDLDRTYRGETDALPGIRKTRDWPRFWRMREEPTTYPYGPGMMNPSRPPGGGDPYIYQGSWVTYGPNVP